VEFAGENQALPGFVAGDFVDMEKLREKTLTGFIWNVLERVGYQVITFIPTILLARLLAPEQFGLIGMLAIFMLLANTFLDSGFGVALIQKRDATYVDECSIFYFNLVIGIFLTLALCLAAPLIAAFYNQPELTNLTRVMSLRILINSFNLIQTVRLTRSLDFKTQVKAKLLAAFSAGLIAVVLAYFGFGVWSLVAENILDGLISTVALWIVCDWRPRLVFSLQSLKGMFNFGSRMLTSSLVTVVFDNLYQMFIGKVFSAAALGYYTRANTVRQVAMDSTSNAIGRVMFPALASVKDEPERLQRGYRKSVMLSTFVNFPIMIGLIVVARPLILVLFSAKWLTSATFLQLLSVTGLLSPLQVINLDVLKVKGRSDLFLKISLINRVAIIANIFITYRWGINAMLIGQIGVALIAYFLNSYYSERLIGYSMKSQVKDVLPSFFYSCLMGGGAALVGLLLREANSFVTLFAQTGAGVILYLLIGYLTKSELLAETFDIIKKLPNLLVKG
jgi:O-antigen/teichoic acid export membrane protein